ncbi:MAG: hypothetical protein PHU12_00350 [Candidatus Aenigmarchaeota archaeon]|nr:hypothetical protein [Candidatus Aenigmarchaeota archaeon]
MPKDIEKETKENIEKYYDKETARIFDLNYRATLLYLKVICNLKMNDVKISSNIYEDAEEFLKCLKKNAFEVKKWSFDKYSVDDLDYCYNKIKQANTSEKISKINKRLEVIGTANFGKK